MSAVFDATAIAVWLTGGPGARTVGELLTHDDGVISALSVLELGRALPADRLADVEQLATIAPFEGADALAASELALPQLGIPELATVVLGARLGATIVTADPSLDELGIPGLTVQVIGSDEG